jgi:hypothetical protein
MKPSLIHLHLLSVHLLSTLCSGAAIGDHFTQYGVRRVFRWRDSSGIPTSTRTSTIPLTLTAPPPSASPFTTDTQITTLSYDYSETYTIVNVVYSTDEWPGPAPTATSSGSTGSLEVYTYSAADRCPNTWTATTTRTLSVNAVTRTQMIARATSTTDRFVEVQTAPDYDAGWEGDPQTWVAWKTYTWSVTDAKFYILPTGLAEPTVWNPDNQIAGYGYPESYGWRDQPAPEQFVESCQPPNLTAPGSNFIWYAQGNMFIEDPAIRKSREKERRRRWNILWGTIPSFISAFVLGFIESLFWFSRLMQGRRALRGGTVVWGLMTGLLGFFLVRKQRARPEEERAELAKMWREIPARRRVQLWVKWGFRWRYPVEFLGEAPGDAGQAVGLADVSVMRPEAVVRRGGVEEEEEEQLPPYTKYSEESAPGYEASLPRI